MKSNLFKAKMTLLKDTVYGPMSADLLERNLGDLCDTKNGVQTGPFGSQLHKKDYVAVGTPIITVEHLGENRIIHEDLPQVSDEDKDRLSKYVLRQGDIVFSRVGSVDRRSLVRKSEDGWLFSGRCLRVRPNPNWIDAVYLSYFLGFPTFKEHIRSIAVGATMPSINTKILKDVAVYFPPLPEQRRIAHILGTLDDKIELNRRMNETLEEMARAIFKDWFVDFGPVRAKMEGRDAYLPEEIWRLFPDRLVESELGEVPEGWGVRALGESYDLTMGQSPPGKTYNDDGEGVPFFQGRTDFGFRYPTNRRYCTAPTRFANPDDTLVSVRAPVGDINMAWGRCCVGRGLAALRHESGSRSFTYYSALAIQDRFRDYEHTGTVFGAINKQQFESLTVIEPDDHLVAAFDDLVCPADAKIRTNVSVSLMATATRDALLPALVSGGIRVRV